MSGVVIGESPRAGSKLKPAESKEGVAKPDKIIPNFIGVHIEVPWYKRWFPFLFYEAFVVLWKYEGMKPDEISTERGQLVYVKNERYMSGRRWRWAWVQDADGKKEGYIPSAYLIPHKETMRATYKGDWYLGTVGRADMDALRSDMEAMDIPVGTFAMCKIADKTNIASGDEYAILVRVLGSALTGLGDATYPGTEDMNTADSEFGPKNGGTVGVYKVRRDTHLRYFVNPGNPSPNLYSLVSRLKCHPMTIPVRLTMALPLRPEEMARQHDIPPPPAHPTRVPLDVGPNIDMMTNEEKRELLRPFGVKSSDIIQGQQLGTGNFGIVCKGKWKRRKQGDEIPVALKQLTKKEKEKEKGFREEALIMAKLDHQNVVSFYGYDDALHTLVMEVIDGGSLESFLKKQRSKEALPARTLVDVVYQVASGMAHVESQHFIHRDLATRNCLLGTVSGEGRRVVKISDFGLAVPMTGEQKRKKPQEEMEAWWLSGCEDSPVRWLALESLKGKQYSHKTDVWSFAILMQEVWTMGGNPYGEGEPFLTDPILFIRFLEEGGRVEQEETMSKPIADLQNKCMDADPDQRPFFSEIQRYLQGLLLHTEFFGRDIDVLINTTGGDVGASPENEEKSKKSESESEYQNPDEND